MGASAIAVVNFGAAPGSFETTVVITGQAGIIAGSLVEAWAHPATITTIDADEYQLEEFMVQADPSTIVPGTGFTIRAWATMPPGEPQEVAGAGRLVGTPGLKMIGARNVGWVWF